MIFLDKPEIISAAFSDGVQRCQPRVTKVDVPSWIRQASKRTTFDVNAYSGDDRDIYQRLFKYPYCLIYEREDI
jgi:hypothetical protein